MAWVNVRVNGCDGRNVYIDGNYDEAQDRKAPGPYLVTPGTHTFETLNRKSQVDNRAEVDADASQPSAVADFEPVDPPEDTDG